MATMIASVQTTVDDQTTRKCVHRRLPPRWKHQLREVMDKTFIENVLHAGDVLKWTKSLDTIMKGAAQGTSTPNDSSDRAHEVFQQDYIQAVFGFVEMLDSIGRAYGLEPELLYPTIQASFCLAYKELGREANIWHWFQREATIQQDVSRQARSELELERRAAENDPDTDGETINVPDTPRKGKPYVARRAMICAEKYQQLRSDPEVWTIYREKFEKEKGGISPSKPLDPRRDKRMMANVSEQLKTSSLRGIAHVLWAVDTKPQSDSRLRTDIVQASRAGGRFVEKLDLSDQGFNRWKSSAQVDSAVISAELDDDLHSHYSNLLQRADVSMIGRHDASSDGSAQDETVSRDKARTNCVTRFRTLLNLATGAVTGDAAISPYTTLPHKLEETIQARWGLRLWIRKATSLDCEKKDVLQIRHRIRHANGAAWLDRFNSAMDRGDIQFSRHNPWPEADDVSNL